MVSFILNHRERQRRDFQKAREEAKKRCPGCRKLSKRPSDVVCYGCWNDLPEDLKRAFYTARRKGPRAKQKAEDKIRKYVMEQQSKKASDS